MNQYINRVLSTVVLYQYIDFLLQKRIAADKKYTDKRLVSRLIYILVYLLTDMPKTIFELAKVDS